MGLDGKRGAILVEDLYEDLELWYPALRMRERGRAVGGRGGGRGRESGHLAHAR